MADINRVYQTVQNLLNKEQRGYLPPSEFNNLAAMAQTEIFELYFHDYNFFENAQKAGRTNTEFADLPKHFRERINRLSTTATITHSSANGVYTLPTNLYRLVEVNSSGVPVEEDDHDTNRYAQLSTLARSTTSRPTYTRIDNNLDVYPSTLTTDLNITYIRTPNTPQWGYVTVNGEPFYESSRSTNFDIHPADETELIIKILLYAGITIKADEIVQYADKLEATDTNKENRI